MVDQRESIRLDDRLDEALDEFERLWSSDSCYLLDFVSQNAEINQLYFLAELIRVDIDRRYAADVDVDLITYFTHFPKLLQDLKVVSAIGFEDFRSRRSRSLSVACDRWSWMPGVTQASWFTALCEATPKSASSRLPVQTAPIGVAKRCNDPNDAHIVPFDLSGNGEPRVGNRFGEFQLLAVLGKGSFSTVYLATQVGLASRYVALKVVRRPLDEPTHLARLQHTGIVPLFSLHRIGQYTALCMPYFGSATLADWFGSQEHPSRDGQSLVGTVQSAQMRLTATDGGLAGQALDVTEFDSVRVWNTAGAQPLEKLRALDARHSILWLTQRLAAALAHAHERGVIHGDLKPANILLRNDGEPALIDFNLSKHVGHASIEWAGGTLPYMSPEQLRMLLGQETRLDASADVYSLGIILFELVENRLPFPPPLSQADSDVEVAVDARKQIADMHSSSASVGLKAIIRKCLNFAPVERYTSALSLLEDVEREFANQPLVHAEERFFAGRLPKLARRFPRLFSAGPVALISLLIIGLLTSATIVGWSKYKLLDAENRLAHFREESKRLLAAMMDPTPTERDQLLADSNQLAKGVLGLELTVASEESIANFEHAMRWLGPTERTAVREELSEFCITATALTCGSVKQLTPVQREPLRQMVTYCSTLTNSPKSKFVLDNLLDLLQYDGQDTVVRYEAMMRLLEDHLDIMDTNSEPHGLIELLQARTDLRRGQAQQAMERLQNIAPQNSLTHLYWMISGDAHAQLQQFEAAIQAYGLALSAIPKSVTALVQRAEASQQLRNYQAAEEDYSRAVEFSPSAASLYMRRALAREKQGKLSEAIADMDTALELEPTSNRMLFSRARMHHLADHRDDYFADFKRGLSTTPKLVDDWVSRALAQLPRYPEKAKSDLEAALRIEPKSLLALQNLAFVESEHLHDEQAALCALDEILELSPMNEPARAGRCVLYARLDHTQECLNDLEILAKEEQRLLPSTLYQMGCAHALISKEQEEHADSAIRSLAKAIRRGYGMDVMATDPDLDAVRGHASFAALKTIADMFNAQ